MTETPRIRRIAAAGCAVALVTMLGACASSTSSASSPPGGSGTSSSTSSSGTGSSSATGSSGATSSSSSASASATGSQSSGSPSSGTPSTSGATGSTGGFLAQSDLPDYPAYGWTKPQLNEVNVEHPLPGTCGNSLGPQVTNGVSEADYGSRAITVTAVEDIYTYASAAAARAQLSASLPKCGGITAEPTDGFAWRGGSPAGMQHVLFVLHGNKLATLTITPGSHDYNASLDAGLLTEMLKRLESA